MGKKVHKELKKVIKEKEPSKVGMYVQIIFTLITIALVISFLFRNDLLIYLQSVLALDMFIMAYNNQTIYKRTNFTIFYVAVGLVIVGIILIGFLGW